MWGFINRQYKNIKNIAVGVRSWAFDTFWESSESHEDVKQKAQEFQGSFSTPAEHSEMWHGMYRSSKGRYFTKVFFTTNLQHGLSLILLTLLAKSLESLMPEANNYENQEDPDSFANSLFVLLDVAYFLGRHGHTVSTQFVQLQILLDNLLLLLNINKAAIEAEKEFNAEDFEHKKKQLSRDCQNDRCTTFNQSLISHPLAFVLANYLANSVTGVPGMLVRTLYVGFYIADTHLATHKCTTHRIKFIEDNKLHYFAVGVEANALSTAVTLILDYNIPFLSIAPLHNQIQQMTIAYCVALSHFKKMPNNNDAHDTLLVSEPYIQCSKKIISSKYAKGLAVFFKQKTVRYMLSPPIDNVPQQLDKPRNDLSENNHTIIWGEFSKVNLHIYRLLVHPVFIQPHKAILDLTIDFQIKAIFSVVEYIENSHEYLSDKEAIKRVLLSNKLAETVFKTFIFPDIQWLSELLYYLAKNDSNRENVLNNIKDLVFFGIDPLLNSFKNLQITDEGLNRLIDFYKQVLENEPDSHKEMNIQCRFYKNSAYYQKHILQKSIDIQDSKENSQVNSDNTVKKETLMELMNKVIERDHHYILDSDTDENQDEENESKAQNDKSNAEKHDDKLPLIPVETLNLLYFEPPKQSQLQRRKNAQGTVELSEHTFGEEDRDGWTNVIHLKNG